MNFIFQQALNFASPGQFNVHAAHVVVRGASWGHAAAVFLGQFNVQHTRLCKERLGGGGVAVVFLDQFNVQHTLLCEERRGARSRRM